MQDGWERRHQFITLDIPTITDMLRPVLPGKKVVSATPLDGGLVNTNYKLSIAGLDEAYVLRIYARDHQACRKEVDIFRLVHDRVPVPEVLYADTEGARYGSPYTLTKWVEGIMLSKILAGANTADSSRGHNELGTECGPYTSEIAYSEIAYSLGSVLAAIGSYTFPQPGFFGPGLKVEQPPWSAMDYIEECLFQGKAGQRLGETLTQRLWKLIEDNAVYLNEVEGAFALVHADYKGPNILMRHVANGWRTAAVLDWEFAFAGSSLFDIGNMLRYDKQLPPEFEPHFIRGFLQQGGKLPSEWKRISKLLDLVNLCGFLNALDQGGTLFEDATKLITETIEDWESY
ncbi:MAG TPA: aminoglycoside phosphotransferase family protein [Ktedonobacteraceae bacterium]|nr:aminoglycoside phosphotransferase family protein [Ktedonobacteraceae bacterium]